MTAAKTCSAAQCGRKHYAKGLCNMHYRRERRGSKWVRYETPEESFAARTEWRDGCLMWTGTLEGAGYGQINIGGRPARAHRYAWERVHGPIPDGMVIDHVCHVRACVLLDHLRLATHAENAWNLKGARVDSGTGVRGVSRRPNGRYVARVKHARVEHRVGTFDTLEEAAAAAEALRVRLFGKHAGPASHLRALDAP